MRIVSGAGASVSDGAGGIGAEVSLTEDGAGAAAVGALVVADVDVPVTFCAIAPGSGNSEFVSGWARRTSMEKKRTPHAPRNTVLNFPPYGDVRKIITYSN